MDFSAEHGRLVRLAFFLSCSFDRQDPVCDLHIDVLGIDSWQIDAHYELVAVDGRFDSGAVRRYGPSLRLAAIEAESFEQIVELVTQPLKVSGRTPFLKKTHCCSSSRLF